MLVFIRVFMVYMVYAKLHCQFCLSSLLEPVRRYSHIMLIMAAETEADLISQQEINYTEEVAGVCSTWQ